MYPIESTRPSRRGARPSALGVSFGIDDRDDSETTSDASSSRKRDRGEELGNTESRNTKRRNLDGLPRPIRKYEPRQGEILETKDLFIFGEDQNPPDDNNKPTRFLSRFAFFDPEDENRMVSPDAFGENEGADRRILGAGFVVAKNDVDEDEGQEDDLDVDDNPQYIRLSRIQRYFTRYWDANSPFFLETDHAIYELDVLHPSKRYRSIFRPFWRLQTILRFVISSANDDPNQEFSAFQREYERLEVFDEPLTRRELWESVPNLRQTLETVPSADKFRESIIIHHLLFSDAPIIFKAAGKSISKGKEPIRDHPLRYTGDLDLAVLRETNPTHITPRIAQIAEGLFRERLIVVGPKPRPEPDIPKDDLFRRVQGFLMRTQRRRPVQLRPNQRIRNSCWLKHAMIDDVKYEVGDTVLFYPGDDDIPPDPDDLPSTDTLATHFWFARIVHMHGVHETVHVQWLEHSSKTFLQELGNAQELFLTDQCDTQKLTQIIGTVRTHYLKPNQSLAHVRPHDFFCRFQLSHEDGAFTDVDVDALAASVEELPPDNCLACQVSNKCDEGQLAEKIHLGVRWHGVDYHTEDCVFIKADEGPCHIGQILKFIHAREDAGWKVVVRLFGRTDKVGSRPVTTLKNERHLFCTDAEMTIPIKLLIGVCFVVVKDDMPDLDTWLEMAPNRFFVKYYFPSLSADWDERRRMKWKELPICPMCMKQDLKKFKGMKTFLEKKAPLRIFDPFGGVGAFCLAMEEVGCFKLTHAVEISPSAAKTLRNNASPDVKVYNQCSNLVLHHAILTHENKYPDPLKSIQGRELPPPLKPGDIDCIVAGFPCQPHSTLNMYQKAHDRKSTLILNVLSYVDFLKPTYCIFENVRGFLRYSLRAHQASKYVVKGGIPMGGLKLVAVALLDMGYQLRCGLLQAAHYGTPQTRVRFFIIAAKRGVELPPFPQPTHDFPHIDGLELKFPEEITLRPITTLPGVAPHRYVSVQDAISDLPRFDWKHPEKVLSRRQMNENRIKECLESQRWCGFDGPDVPYEHEPRTTFQKKCRRRPTRDIQQYTRTYYPKKVERVVEIPVEEDADYRSLRPDLWEWQFANPASAVARSGYRAKYYARVKGDGWFQTTVANVDPMAKQSRVLHPYSKRIVTVRELARSQGFPDHFVFHAAKNNVTTMHRQIGNAAPWPVSIAIAREFREVLYRDWLKSGAGNEPAGMEGSDGDEMDVG